MVLLFCNVISYAQFPGGGMFGGGDANKIYDGKITGNVTDGESQKPLELANIALYYAGEDKPLDGTVTDEKGNFKLKNIKPGDYTLSVTAIGFQSLTRAISVSSSLTVNLVLDTATN